MNNDGIDDVIIGNSNKCNPDGSSCGGNGEGAAYVIYGPTNASGLFNASIIANVTFYGLTSGEDAGYAVSSGDINNDGIDDVIIGADAAGDD